LAGDDVSVRVLTKTPVHLSLEHADLGDHGGDDRDQGTHAGAVGAGESIGQAELLAAQRLDDPGSGGVEVALPSGARQQCLNPDAPWLIV